MRFRHQLVDPRAPGVQRLARRYELKLKSILLAASRRNLRRDPDLANLYRTAKIMGINPDFPTRSACIEFAGPPLPGRLLEIYDWSLLGDASTAVQADLLAWGLLSRVKEARRGK
jgi:hypothetical protein